MKRAAPALLTPIILFSLFTTSDARTSNHKVSISVPEVSLLQIKSSPRPTQDTESYVTFKIDASTGSFVKQRLYYDITSNAQLGTSQTHKILVSADTPYDDWTIKMQSLPLSGAKTPRLTLSNTETSGTLVSEISNVAMKNIGIDVELMTSKNKQTPTPSNYDTSLTFTLTNGT